MQLNFVQRFAFDTIMSDIFSNEEKCYFIDGPGGTGKMFLYCSLFGTLRSQGQIAIAVSTSGALHQFYLEEEQCILDSRYH